MVLENRQSYYKYSTNGSFTKQENSLRTKKHKNRSFPFVFKAIGIGCLVFFVGLIIIFYVYQYVQIATLNYQIASCEKTLEELEIKKQNLRLTIAQKNNLKEIEEKARTRYDMVQATDPYYLTLNKDNQDIDKTENMASSDSKNFALIVHGVTDWFKNLTSVEAGTLDN